MIRTAHRLGIASPLEPNASIALGTSEVSVLELVGAYATFANGGYETSPHVIERINDAKGKLLYARDDRSLGRVVDDAYVAEMNAMMQQTLLIGTAKHAALAGWPAAGKTGTSQDFRDAWFIGYTAHLVTGVWLGNDDNTPTKHTTGGSLPVEIWSRFMTERASGRAGRRPARLGRRRRLVLQPVRRQPLQRAGAASDGRRGAGAAGYNFHIGRVGEPGQRRPRRLAAE